MKIAILGTGAYGIAQSKILSQNGHEIIMWSRFDDEIKRLIADGENLKVLPGVKLDLNVKLTSNLGECVSKAEIIVIAIPTTSVRSVAKELSKIVRGDQIICITSKGIENETNALISDMLEDEIKTQNVVVLSGPSFAGEIANYARVGYVIASKKIELSSTVKNAYANDKIVFEFSEDIKGVQICSSLKNVFAVIAGMIRSIDSNDSTFAMIFTQLLKDFKRLLKIFGGEDYTVNSYAGIGDFFLTCTSPKSRNYTFGSYIGQGFPKEKSLELMNNTTVEGLNTLKSVYEYLNNKNVYVASIYLIYDIVYRYHNPEEIYKCMN